MKYQINWNSPLQGAQSTTIDAINGFAAREQFDSMYGSVQGLNVISISPVFEKEEYKELEESYSSESSSGGEMDDPSVMIATLGILGGIAVAFYGLFTLPAGIIAMLIGGAIGWVGWKIGCWLSDKGW